MANIPLRAYIREIEGLIDSGQLEETVAHSRHALQSYPKYIDIYRLLGKVFLESRQFSNAGDILQRVLSAIPDDFVSHVGMSIIREDEGNLDAAIWHMERAFENQPANNAIQGELMRLFGRRDGMEPPKIRLTRGALARMFAKGNLYDQAVAELHGALSEDPQRPDLQILLAKMNFLSGNRVDAVETSSNILKKFPNCLIANRILALILPQTDRAEDAKIYQERSIALDPYLSRAGSDALTSEDVSDSAVMIDALEWKPGQTIPGLPEQPAWAGALGIKFEESEEELPEWLSEDLEIPAYEGQQVAPFIESEGDLDSAASDDTEQLIPEWMQEAGWQPASGEAEDIFQMDELSEYQEGQSEIERAEIPEWLQEIAPEDAEDDEAILDESVVEELPTWLDESTPGATDTIISWLDEKDETSDSSEAVAQSGDEFEVISHALDESVIPEEEETADEIEIPEWLKDLETEGELELPIENALGDDELPDWLEELEESTGDIPKSGVLLEEIVSGDEVDTSKSKIVEDQLSDEFKEEEQDELEIDNQAAALAWLENLAAKQGASEDELITSPEERLESPPDWISEEKLSLEEEISTEPRAEEKLPDWLLESKYGDDQMDKEVLGEEEGELPVWLREMDEEKPQDFAPELPINEEVDYEVGTLDIEEPVSTDADEIVLGEEIPSELETPKVSEYEREHISDSAEWIPETQDTEESHLERTKVSELTYEEIDQSIVREPSEELAAVEHRDDEVMQVDINSASLSELEKISGIGFVLAQSIVEYREVNGLFDTIDDLKNVSGIGDISFESFKDHLKVEESTKIPESISKEEVPVDDDIVKAQKALEHGDFDQAVEAYNGLIQRGIHLDEIISHLEQGTAHNPDNIHLLQTLGDAYMRNDQFQQALDAYTKAEKLL